MKVWRPIQTLPSCHSLTRRRAVEYQVDTPEAIHISYQIAGIGSRFGAILLDIVILSVLFTLLIFGVIGIAFLPTVGPTVAIILLLSLYLLLPLGYFVLFEADRKSGRV